jgi:fatty acid desaturase
MPLLKLISMNKINDEKIKRVKQRKILKVFIIFFGLATLVLAIHSLVTGFTPILAIISFLIEALLSRYRNKLDPKLVTSDLKNPE